MLNCNQLTVSGCAAVKAVNCQATAMSVTWPPWLAPSLFTQTPSKWCTLHDERPLWLGVSGGRHGRRRWLTLDVLTVNVRRVDSHVNSRRGRRCCLQVYKPAAACSAYDWLISCVNCIMSYICQLLHSIITLRSESLCHSLCCVMCLISLVFIWHMSGNAANDLRWLMVCFDAVGWAAGRASGP